MKSPFALTEGPSFLYDANGNPIASTPVVADYRRVPTQALIQGGNSPYYIVDVELIGGIRRLKTDATVTVEQIFGFDDFADVWFFILTSGSIGDTVRIQIAAGLHDSTSPDSDIPATDKTIILTVSEIGNELALRDKIITELNADVNFALGWKASAIKDNAAIHISSKFMGEFGERLTALDFRTTTTGTTTTQDAFDSIRRRGKQNTGTRDPRDKRLVTVGISGEVTTTPGVIGDLFILKAYNATYGYDLTQNGSLVTPIIYTISADALKDTYVEELRFFGNDGGVKFGQFLSINTILTNGILVEIRSDG
jgi:hypothetical protein